MLKKKGLYTFVTLLVPKETRKGFVPLGQKNTADPLTEPCFSFPEKGRAQK